MLDSLKQGAQPSTKPTSAVAGLYAQLVAAGNAHIQTGDVAAAAEAAATLCRNYPRQPAGPILQARCASAAGDPAAVELWRGLLQRFNDRARPLWFASLSRALFGRGDRNGAESILRRGLERFPENGNLRFTLLQLLLDSNDRTSATRELSDGLFSRAGGGSPLERMRLQNWLGDIAAARASFNDALESATEIPDLMRLFLAIPINFEVFIRGELWRVLRSRLDRGTSDSETPDAVCLQLRIDLALRDYDRFLARHAEAPPLAAIWAARFNRLAEILQAPAFPDFEAPRVFGIGLSKTGTSSLGEALNKLGYLQAHFLNPFTNEIIGEHDFALFDAVTDTPASARFEALHHSFPNAKFILTERALEDWVASFEQHFLRSEGSGGYASFRVNAVRRNQFRYGADLAWVHAGLYFSQADQRAAWHAHAARVAAFFADKPAGKLLRHNVFEGHGWAELCGFLGRPMPDEAYPWSNRSS